MSILVEHDLHQERLSREREASKETFAFLKGFKARIVALTKSLSQNGAKRLLNLKDFCARNILMKLK